MTEDARGGRRRRRRWWGAAAGLLVVLLASCAAFLGWTLTPYRADPVPLAEAVENPAVQVRNTGDAVVVAPARDGTATGVVFYPGARVEAEAYVASWVPVVADTGATVVIPRMRLNMAVFDVNRADSAVSAVPDVDTWYVGGHSLGGAMAASYAGGDPAPGVEGLILWASYATESAGLADRDDLRVLAVAGGRDALTSPEEFEENARHLPGSAETVSVEGMNHAQFGSYGPQDGDNEAALSDGRARAELAGVTGAFLAPGAAPEA
ncbi:alpha/beta hydrolase [Nocardiopsis sp. CA-288880]|uniref:alpha/beta hydrolase n=1 Tax=Nocardiopsis sp. CA-288880 TaxID=3239995 RepID=UPI003D967150